jgi:hypothetical protein
MLQRNYGINVSINDFAWKHGCVPVEKYPVPAIVTIRHPLSWLDSLYRFGGPGITEFGTFRDFIMLEKKHSMYENPWMHIWNWANYYWTERIDGAQYIKLEDILIDPIEAFNKVVEGWGRGKIEEIEFPKKYAGPNGTGENFYQIAKREVEELKYLKNYTGDMVEYVSDRCDPKLIERFGYTWPKV